MRNRRIFAALALTASFGLLAAACGNGDDSTSATTSAASTTTAPSVSTTGGPTTSAAANTCAPKAQGTPVGLLYDVTGRGDQSFNDSAAAGADEATKLCGVKVTESTPSGDADRAERIKLISATNQMAIAVGFLWGDALKQAATDNPKVSYGIIDSVVDAPNVASLTFAEEQGSYLVGVGAATMSKKGSIGFIGGVENDLIKKFEAGYVAGAKSVKPDIKVEVKYITQPPDFSGFNDAAKAKEIAKAMYSGGADIVYHAAGGSGQGLFSAAKEAGKPGEVWAIGVDSDQYLTVSADLKPYILTSMLKRVNVAVFNTIKAFTEGTFKPGVTTFDLKADGVGYATSGDFLTPEAIKAMEAAKADIVSGKITVPTKPA